MCNSLEKITQIQEALESEQSVVCPSWIQMSMLKKELVMAYKEEKSHWQERSREKWLQEGDNNTKFFHASVKANRTRMRIDKLMDENGNFQKS